MGDELLASTYCLRHHSIGPVTNGKKIRNQCKHQFLGNPVLTIVLIIILFIPLFRSAVNPSVSGICYTSMKSHAIQNDSIRKCCYSS